MFNLPFGDDEVEFLPMMSIEEEDDSKKETYKESLPILPLRNTVLYPGVVIPITVGRDKSLKAVKEAYKADKIIGVVAQQDARVEDPETKDLSEIGTVARIVKLLKMPDGSNTVIIQGKQRFKIKEFTKEDPYIRAKVEYLAEEQPSNTDEFNATVANIKELAGEIIRLAPNIPSEAAIVLKNIDSPTFLMHFISSNLNNELVEKQAILAEDDLYKRSQMVLTHLNKELQMLELRNRIQSKVKSDIEKQQKDYFLHQQLKTIQEELGADEFNPDIKRLKEKSRGKKWSKPVQDTFTKELEKLERMNAAAAEYSVSLNYLDLLLELPWEEYTKDNFDLSKARKILDKDHYGLDKIKDRILEYLAVLKLKGDMKSPILCFVGPPGVGKTSLGRSIAQSLNRKYVRMSLGGLHDESEIRGHRKTYIGAMPGRVIQSIKKVKTGNPVFILDEVDKVGTDFRGDPSSALLEVLDPEQNNAFYDNYLELEYDLSKVLFIATANSLNTIQPALRDRMEIIMLGGYSVEEKIEIAKRHLVPKTRTDHGIKPNQVKISDKVLEAIIDKYTREAGVRELDRQLAGIMRFVAKHVAMNEEYNPVISKDQLHKILGAERYDRDIFTEKQPAGVAIGLAWTSVGGDILFIEASLSKGKGILTLTGNLGDVMKESATTALSYIRANTEKLGVDVEDFSAWNVHIHVPEGAIPKDGPSAGITMLTALASAFTGRAIKPYLAMTGEITLRGKVLPVGGIKEKILAAKRSGLKEIILCKTNKRDIAEIPAEYLEGLTFHYVERMEEVLELALEPVGAKVGKKK